VSKSPSGIIGISTDITQKKAMEAKIKHLIDHDQLTNAYTRRKVFETLKEKLANNETITVAILDIDHFKTVNDTHGHIVGDEILKKYVKRLETKLDDNDMVGRFGGEEFIIIFNDKDKYTAKKALEDVLESLKKHPLDIREKRIVLSFSGGICTPKEFEDTSNIKNVLAIADNRLYKAKQNGRNQIHID
jgi:diguanylate cyclase (GGDEF)-like protein